MLFSNDHLAPVSAWRFLLFLKISALRVSYFSSYFFGKYQPDVSYKGCSFRCERLRKSKYFSPFIEISNR